MTRTLGVDGLAARCCVACLILIPLGVIGGGVALAISIVQRRWVSDWVFDVFGVAPGLAGAALGLGGSLWLSRSSTALNRPGMTGSIARAVRRGDITLDDAVREQNTRVRD